MSGGLNMVYGVGHRLCCLKCIVLKFVFVDKVEYIGGSKVFPKLHAAPKRECAQSQHVKWMPIDLGIVVAVCAGRRLDDR